MFSPLVPLGTSTRVFVIALAFYISLTAAFPATDEQSPGARRLPSNPYASDGGAGNHWKIFTNRIIKVFGVAIGVTLVTTVLALLPIGAASYLYGCYINSRRTSDKSSSSVEYRPMPGQQNGNCAGHPLIYIGLSALIGIPCGVISGMYAWPYL